MPDIKRNISIEDVTYDNHFPGDIDRSKYIIVQITENPIQSIVLYTSSSTGKDTRCYLPLDFAVKYQVGLTIL